MGVIDCQSKRRNEGLCHNRTGWEGSSGALACESIESSEKRDGANRGLSVLQVIQGLSCERSCKSESLNYVKIMARS